MTKKYFTYEEFGAAGDGVTDDFAAIIACHEEANKTGTPVKAKDGAKYYIGGKAAYATIKTDVDFGTAEFTIDDRAVENRRVPLFKVISDAVPFTPDIKTLKKGQKKIDFPHEGTVFVTVKNENKPIFIRKGLNRDNGHPTQDILIVDGDGNILCNVDWDYDEITYATAKSIDDTPITIEGGKFTTISNHEEAKYNYFSRNIQITRPNVTVKGLTHLITDVPEEAAPYAGFIDIGNTANIKVIDCLLTPRFIYWTESQMPGQKVAMGSYGIGLGSSINIFVKNMKQTIDIQDRRYWGLVCSNFCKNLTFEDCNISRFDAHMGVSNVTLKNCTFGHQCVNLIGFGKALVENCHIYGPQLIGLRSDYGSVFFGDLKIKDTVWHPTQQKVLRAIVAYNTGDHDFGYECHMPEIEIDGLTIADENNTDAKYYIMPNYTYESMDNIKYPYHVAKVLKIRNIKRESGGEVGIYEIPEQYPTLTVIKE